MNNSAITTQQSGAHKITNDWDPQKIAQLGRTTNICRDQELGPLTEDCLDLNPVEKSPALWQYLATAALQQYNIDSCKTQEDAGLHVSGEVKASVIFFSRMAGFHLAFQAQDNLKSAPKNVFAEVFWSKGSANVVVNFCGVMDSSIRPELLKYCKHCSWEVLHPNMEFFKTPPIATFGEDAASFRRHPVHYVWSMLA